MKRPGPPPDPELEALLQRRKIEREVPPDLRARVLARARATVAGDEIPPAQPWVPAPAPLARGRRVLRIALAASIAVAVGAVGAVAALRGFGARHSDVAPADGTPPAPRRSVSGGGHASTEPPAPAAESEPARPVRSARFGSKADPFTAELDLLQRAHGAYTRRDFSAALALIADHARRFPNGHLAEQREALRVRSLAGAGHADEAHRAAAAFAARFPRSVLLPRVEDGRVSSQR
jgi:hypothetical protein